MKKTGITFIVSAIIPFVLGIYKLLVYESGQYGFDGKNAYVGGDAYNYIINANYFTGFMVMALILVVIGCTFLICNELILARQVENKENETIQYNN